MIRYLTLRQRRAILAGALLTAALAPLFGGAATAAPVCNALPIVYTPPDVDVEPLSPYPSSINILGLSGTVTDVNVTFNDITYPFPEDLDVLLVAPAGGTNNLIVMSDIGGSNGGGGNPVTDVDLTFDDEAPSTPSADGQLVSGTYQPLNDVDVDEFSPDTFPPPAPTQSTATALSVFDGLDPNGTWSLYVVDDEPGPDVSGDFGGGWCIDISTDATTTSSTTTTLPPTTTTTSSTTTTTLPPTTTTSSTTTTLPPTTTTSTTTTLPPTTTTSTTVPTGPTCLGQAATIVGTSGNDRIIGTAATDVIVGLGGTDNIYGLEGDDIICGGGGNDVIDGGEGNDAVDGEAGDDRVIGGLGNDDLAGGDGSDRIFGAGGDDQVAGDANVDYCYGGTGTNTFATCEVFPAGQ